MYINILCSPILHFMMVSHAAELIGLGTKIIGFFWSEHPASQKAQKKSSAIELVTNTCFVFLANSAKPKVFQRFILPLNGRTNSLEGNYIFAHYSLKSCLFYFIFAAKILWPNSFLFTATICQERLENIAHFSFWRFCYSKNVFSLHFFCQLCKFL